MPIVVRRGRVIAEPRSRLLRFDRPTTATTATGAVGVPVADDDPRHELARLALDVVIRTAAPIEVPASWLRPGFALEVDRTRAQLAPIRTRKGLMASFSREASIAATRIPPGLPTTMPAGQPAPAQPPPGPIRVAYAIRWLELGDGRPRGPWVGIVRGSLVVVAGTCATEGGTPGRKGASPGTAERGAATVGSQDTAGR